jgi:hypothetical protein
VVQRVTLCSVSLYAMMWLAATGSIEGSYISANTETLCHLDEPSSCIACQEQFKALQALV